MAEWNGFKGRAKRLDDIDLPKLGSWLGVGEDHIHMFLDVETTGSGFLRNGEVKKLFERHKFYSELKSQPEKLQKAIKAGLANTRAGGYGKESEQRAKIERAMAIDETAALRATSWGIGQVMGFNHEAAGYDTPQAMVLAFMDDEESQLEGAVNFILNNHLDDELRKCKPGDPESCRPFASGYNGSGYARNRYHEKMAEALLKWSRIKDTPWAPDVDLERDVLGAAQEVEKEPQPVPMPGPAPEPPSAPAGNSERKSVNPLAAAAAAIFGTIIVWATGFFEWVAEMVKWPWW